MIERGDNMAGRDRRNDSGKGSRIGSILSTLVIIVALAVFCYAGYQLVTIYFAYKAGSDEYNELEDNFVVKDTQNADEKNGDGDASGAERLTEDYDEENMVENETMAEDEWGDSSIDENATMLTGKKLQKMENPINFDELLAINTDIIGWLEMESVDISYPIVQSDDNDFYLHRTFRKQDNFAGSIFLDYLNSPNFSNRNNIVYGHNMKNGSMFGILKQYQDQEKYDKSKYFWIYTPTRIYKYEIFSASVVGTYSDSYQIAFANQADFKEFLDQAKQQSMIETTAHVSYNDTVVTLSTCTGDSSTRFIVQGKRVRTYQSVPKAGGYGDSQIEG